MEEFLENYREIVWECTNIFDTAEQAFHSLFLGMAVSLYGMYEWPVSNRESGLGRSDIMVKSLNPEIRPHLVVEYKIGKNLEQAKKDALQQIFDRKYPQTLKGPILCLGIAHNGKEADMVWQYI
ncbi:MAG: PD-(D/E)XK nuclease domain-containing protein [Turicibacter sp.]|nr:PD-(D/E)XK nuclease domain-containing protein [Turicibacter sp.]